METSTGNKISWETKNGVGYLTFTDLPENRMDSLFFDELKVLTENIIPQNMPEAIIIHGMGRHFSSGANLDELIEIIKENDGGTEALQSNYHSFQFFEGLKIPVIAVIRGVCIGSGLELALHCHFRMCSQDALLGLPESTFGLMPGAGGIPKMLEIAGKARTIEMAIRGNTFNAEDAFNWGVVDFVFSKNEIIGKAELLAELASTNYRKYNKKEYVSNLLNHKEIK